MKSIIIYYSMSGNTRKIAQAIHRGMSGSETQCDIVRLRDVSTGDLTNYELIGLGSPVIDMQEPSIVSRFIQDTMKFVDGKHAFAFCTHGTLPAYYLARVIPAMRQRGLIIIGWKNWFCSVLYPPCPKPYFTDGHPDEIDLREAEDFGREMAEHSRRIYQGETQLIPRFPTGTEYDRLYMPFTLDFKDSEGAAQRRQFQKTIAAIKFKVNTTRCQYPKCTFCIDNCPNGSIDFSVSPPVFDINCDKCFLCEQTCPNAAIEADYMPFQKVHDPIAINVLQKSIQAFEELGHFRRLVPLEEIGWQTPFWTFKKPRFKIP